MSCVSESAVKFQIPQHFRLPAFSGVPLPTHTIFSTYYDTDGYRLTQAGITLCYQGKQEGWRLTLESASTPTTLHYPGRAATPPAAATELLWAYTRGHTLHPVARLRVRQSGVRVHDLEGPCADIQVHLVAVYEGRRVRFALGEVLLVPTTPHSDVLPRLTQALHDAGAMAGDPRPLLWQVLELPALPPWPEVAPEAPLAEHLQHALRAQIQALLRSDPGTRLGSDPEDLHQMRVATRRLRAYLRAVRPILEGEWGEALRSELAWLGGYLGPVRDLDVLLARFQAACAGLPAPEQRAFSRLLPQLERQRQSARATMLTALQSARYLQLLTRLETAAHAPEVVSSNLTLAAMASAAFKRLRKAMSKLEPTASAEALHRVRIYGKRARYTAELALVTAGKPATRFLQQAKAFQDLLGEHQDAVVAETHLRALLRHTRGTLAAFTVGRLVERQQISRQQVRTALPEVWAQLARRGRKAWRVHQGGNSSAVTNMTATPG